MSWVTHRCDPDHVAVELITGGYLPGKPNHCDLEAAVTIMRARNMSLSVMADRAHVAQRTIERTVRRIKTGSST